ncbi:MAG TPA: ABC transporter permease [Candidatus Acidoferrum sp.]|nr:ABC transporter permease [Candidatus Acidoferrum sp.]
MLDWGWIGDHIGAIASRTGQHIELTAIALIVGFAISFGLTLLSLSQRRLYPIISGIAGILYTIPSLAVFSAFVVITGITLLTVEIPLIMYTLVIFVRNMVAGFDSVPDDVLDAADGMGYTRRQRLFLVQLPLAIPLIVAGLRLASVSTIGLVTITSTLGDSFGGLGFFIKERPFFTTEVLVGAIPSILLAVGADILFSRIERRLTPWSRGGRALPGEPVRTVAVAREAA